MFGDENSNGGTGAIEMSAMCCFLIGFRLLWIGKWILWSIN